MKKYDQIKNALFHVKCSYLANKDRKMLLNTVRNIGIGSCLCELNKVKKEDSTNYPNFFERLSYRIKSCYARSTVNMKGLTRMFLYG